MSEAMHVENSFSGRRWELASCDEDLARGIQLDHQIPAVIARLLASRGVERDAAMDYLNPTLKRLLPEPCVLKHMDEAVARVVAALKTGEKIAVFGDYDVDGSCSAALMVGFLAAVREPPRVYVPDRLTEGYGPNSAALLKLKAEGISLVVTVDCGAGAHVALKAAHEAGLDVVVLDHHASEHVVPALVQVNPNAGGDDSGLGHLCAAGITFLFLVALNRALRQAGFYAKHPEPNLMDAVDLVGLATVCDVVPLTGVNRAFVRAGLARLGHLERPGLKALARIADVAPPFTPYTLGFVFGPRINAGGRVGRCSLGVDLLTTFDAAMAEEHALALDTHNRERQAIEKMILDEATALAAQQEASPFVLVAGEGWHPGVVGIVAGRLKERFGKPAFVAGFEGGLGRGSARSVPGANVGVMVRAAHESGVIESGGGHAMAAGFGLTPAQVEPFRLFLSEAFAKGGPIADVPLAIDATVSPGGATLGLARDLQLAGPYGSGNPEPLLAIPDVRVGFADVVGRGHVRLRLVGGDGARLDAIAFRVAETPLGDALLKSRGANIHAVGRLRAEEWNGQARVQLHLDDAAAAAP
ncbi:single-stranded-DNA-specific exonuclease RecJ [Rhizomicrobium electricum]|uniref:Single-stranded-DNA-specific exonuclease RecJ n=1 Tax=Rhizomicrobium electricum TaxID=480070 RepID=A0ABP3PZB9_9PROT|nr:single-stranded-DNA-specific exonuclease RecJ [Rhizomicrobium electricum]NIJ50228.1 single-stranded-DNA-specific exonuclease [Rhizomicrobium electricum]